jgi:hypothetical protein
MMDFFRTACALMPNVADLDVAADLEAIRARRIERCGEASRLQEEEKAFDMERFYRLVAQPPAGPADTDRLNLLDGLKNRLDAKSVRCTLNVEGYFAGLATTIGHEQALLLHEDIRPARVQAEVKDAADAIATKIMIYELEKEKKALQAQAKALQDQIARADAEAQQREQDVAESTESRSERVHLHEMKMI